MGFTKSRRFGTAALVGAAFAGPCYASPVTTSEIVQVAWDQTNQNDTGSLFIGATGNLAGAELAARERQIDSETDIQGVTYFKFDLTQMTNAAAAIDGDYVARLKIDYDKQLNSVNVMDIYASAVDTANTWADSPGNYPLATWVATNNLGGSTAPELTGDYLILQNVKNTLPTVTSSSDVTNDVAGWISTAVNNNGFVMFGDRDANQGAGFSNARLEFSSVLADYDFAAGTSAPASDNFDHPGNDSADTNSQSTASRLQASGVDGGGAGNIFNFAGTNPDFGGISDTGGPVSNWGGEAMAPTSRAMSASV